MADEPLGSATVRIDPDLDSFEEDLKAKLDEIMADISVSVTVTLDDRELDPELEDVRAKAEAAVEDAMVFTPTVDQEKLDEGLAEVEAKKKALNDFEGSSKSSDLESTASDAQQLAVALSDAALSEGEFASSLADSVPAIVAVATATDGFVESLEGIAAPIEDAVVDFETLQQKLIKGGSTSGLVNSLVWGSAGALDPAAMQTLSELDQAMGIIQEMDASGEKVNEGFKQWGLGLATVNGPLDQAQQKTEEMVNEVDKYSATIKDVQGLLKDSSQMGSYAPIAAAPANVAINEFIANQQAVAYAVEQAGAALEAFESGATTYDEALQQMVMTGMPVEKAIKDLSGSIGKIKKNLLDATPQTGFFSRAVDDLGNALTAIPAEISSMVDGVLAADLGLTDFGEGLDDVLSTFNDFNAATITASEALQSFTELGIDTELAFQLLDEAGITAAEAFQIFEDGAIDAEQLGQLFIQMGLDATTAAQVIGIGAEDIEGAIQVVESVLNAAAEAGGAFTQAMNSVAGAMGSGIEGAVGLIGKLGPMAGIVGLITVAIITAIPIVGVLIGLVGSLAAIGFTAFAGIGALALGASADLSQLEAAAKKAFTSYKAAVAPLVQPIVNAAIPIIGKALNDMIPVAQAAAPAIKNVIDELNTDMSSAGFKTFIEWVSKNTDPAITTISKFGGSVVASLAEMGENGQPFINMVEQGINSLGTDLDNFGKSNTFKDFVNWLVANGPTVGGELEGIGKDFGQIFVALTPTGLTLLSDFVGLMNGLEHTVNAVKDVSHAFTDLFGSGGSLWMAPAILGEAATAMDKSGSSIEDLKSKASDLRTELTTLKRAYADGMLPANLYGVAVDEITNSLVKTESVVGTYNGNLTTLNTQYGLGKTGATDLANALGIDLNKALTGTQVIAFGVAMNEVVTDSGSATDAVYKLGITTDTTTKAMTTAATNAAKAATTAWASYGDAITEFSNSTVPPAASAIESFYSTSAKQATQFSTDAQQAIKDGYDPSVISQALQAGPGQATQFLQALVNAGNTAVSGQGAQLENSMKSSLDTISQEGEQAVQIARLTAMAVAAPTEKIAAALPEAQALYLNETTMNSAKAVQAVMTQYNMTLPQIAQIASEYGNAIPKSIQEQVSKAGLAAEAQTGAVTQSDGEGLQSILALAGQMGPAVPNSLTTNTPATKTAAENQATAALAPLSDALSGFTTTSSAIGNATPKALSTGVTPARIAAQEQMLSALAPFITGVGAAAIAGSNISGALKGGFQSLDVTAPFTAVPQKISDDITEKGTNKTATAAAVAAAKAAFIATESVSFVPVGQSMAQGIASGITGEASVISKALLAVVDQAKTNAEGHIHKGSPSRLFANEIGMPIGQGVAMGMSNNAVLAEVSAAAAKIVNTALVGMQGHTAAVSAGLHVTTTGASGVPSSVSVLGTGSNSFAGVSGTGGTAIHYNPEYTITGDADASTVNKWKTILDQHDNELLEKIKAR